MIVFTIKRGKSLLYYTNKLSSIFRVVLNKKQKNLCYHHLIKKRRRRKQIARREQDMVKRDLIGMIKERNLTQDCMKKGVYAAGTLGLSCPYSLSHIYFY